MGNKSNRELELIIQRLNSQIESKNEQIAELNSFIQQATDNTQELIRNFRSFCVKVLESELAYGDITSRDLESMSLSDLLARARNMLKQNQEKARSIYDTFKERLTQKNQLIQGLNDQVSQLKFMIDNAERMFREPYVQPEELKRSSAFLLETDTPVEALRPALSSTTVLEENERVINLEGAVDKDAVKVVAEGSMYVQDIKEIIEKMKEVHWDILRETVESELSEMAKIRRMICVRVRDEGEVMSADKAGRLLRQMVTELKLFQQIKINTGMRWFYILKLTEIGTKLYVEKFLKKPPITEYQRMIRDHDNAEHGYIIRDVVQILEDTGKFKSVSMSRKSNMIKLPDGRVSVPDIVCCLPNGIEYYEVECGNHHQSDFNEKCDKLKCITQNIFFVSPNRETVEKRLKPQIEEWIKLRGRGQLQLSGMTVYLTSISDLARQVWTYVFNMQEEEPVFTQAWQSENKEEEG